MNTFFSFFKKITDYIKKLDKKKRNMYIVIFGVSILVTTLAVFVLNQKDYVLLYSNLDTKECASIVGRLYEMKID
jgi:flagellar biosynthesis/type III secretory pathway M-ring protein FliF/YscJ